MKVYIILYVAETIIVVWSYFNLLLCICYDPDVKLSISRNGQPNCPFHEMDKSIYIFKLSFMANLWFNLSTIFHYYNDMYMKYLTLS